MAGSGRHPEASLYRRNAARVTDREVLHPFEKQEAIKEAGVLRRRKARRELEERWEREEALATEEVGALLAAIRASAEHLQGALDKLAAVESPELFGKVEGEQQRARTALGGLEDAEKALGKGDFGTCGRHLEEAERELWLVGGQLVVALNQALGQAAVGKEQRGTLEDNLAERRQAKIQLEKVRGDGVPATLQASARLREMDAAGYALAAEILANQVARPGKDLGKAKVGREGEVRVVPPQECETFADVGGLEEVKEQLRATIGAILERPDEAARYHVVHNGILFHGPPGTGKNLLSRALAGEYGMRYLRFAPSSIASAYIHEAASNLRRLFELAKDNVPCVLYLDEIDTIAGARDDQPSADHREVVTQLMICLEEYRSVSGLLIAAGTNNLDLLDTALREGRFDAKILLPLPDPEARKDVFRVHLERRGDAVDWDSIDDEELSRKSNGYNAAALETVVSLAAQTALRDEEDISQAHLLKAIESRGGKDRMSLDQHVTWDDVVLVDDTQEQLRDILNVFSQPDLAHQLGVTPPAGVLLHGPPGTGKTTIAKAMATEVSASFYEQSAADLLSKWAGESEQRVAKLFTKARANRPSIIFIDEIDALLRRRSADSTSKWEERVLSQFLRELDGLKGGDGVLLVGATNRLDVIDEAIVGRRLTPIEVGLPEPQQRLGILQVLTKDVKLAKNVSLRKLAAETEGMSGADLKRLRDAAGMRALSRVAKNGASKNGSSPSVTQADFQAALDAQRNKSSLVEV